MSGGIDSEPLASLSADVAAANEKIGLLWITCGKDDFAIIGARNLSNARKDIGIEHTFVETDGAHHWRVWRRYFRDVSPLLFR